MHKIILLKLNILFSLTQPLLTVKTTSQTLLVKLFSEPLQKLAQTETRNALCHMHRSQGFKSKVNFKQVIGFSFENSGFSMAFLALYNDYRLIRNTKRYAALVKEGMLQYESERAERYALLSDKNAELQAILNFNLSRHIPSTSLLPEIINEDTAALEEFEKKILEKYSDERVKDVKNYANEKLSITSQNTFTLQNEDISPVLGKRKINYEGNVNIKGIASFHKINEDVCNGGFSNTVCVPTINYTRFQCLNQSRGRYKFNFVGDSNKNEKFNMGLKCRGTTRHHSRTFRKVSGVNLLDHIRKDSCTYTNSEILDGDDDVFYSERGPRTPPYPENVIGNVMNTLLKVSKRVSFVGPRFMATSSQMPEVRASSKRRPSSDPHKSFYAAPNSSDFPKADLIIATSVVEDAKQIRQHTCNPYSSVPYDGEVEIFKDFDYDIRAKEQFKEIDYYYRNIADMISVSGTQLSEGLKCVESGVLDLDFDPEEMIKIISEQIRLDKEWVPYSSTSSLYIRPTLIGTDSTLGVGFPHSAKIFVITGPVGQYYTTGFQPISLLADSQYVRAFPGGVGAFKMGCNYAPTIWVGKEAAAKNCQQVLWLYGEQEEITEVGTMNIFVFWKNEDGDHHIYIYFFFFFSLLEMFGAGTACVVCPVGQILYNNRKGSYETLQIPTMQNKPNLMQRFYETINDIQQTSIALRLIFENVSHPLTTLGE
uniref:Branched-chain-amino-acid transaminase n=1 Tax=Heterorhabditis bacteriophora TaxID=37862 RepID=A0A1I7W701_HETBA